MPVEEAAPDASHPRPVPVEQAADASHPRPKRMAAEAACGSRAAPAAPGTREGGRVVAQEEIVMRRTFLAHGEEEEEGGPSFFDCGSSEMGDDGGPRLGAL